MGWDAEEGEGGRSRDEAEWIRRFSLSSFRPDASSSSSPDPQRNERRKSWPREWRQREKGGKAGKGGMYTNRRKKERSPPLAFSPNFARCLRRRCRHSVRSGKPLQFETFQLQPWVALPPFFTFHFVLPLYFHINSYGDQRGDVGVYKCPLFVRRALHSKPPLSSCFFGPPPPFLRVAKSGGGHNAPLHTTGASARPLP